MNNTQQQQYDRLEHLWQRWLFLSFGKGEVARRVFCHTTGTFHGLLLCGRDALTVGEFVEMFEMCLVAVEQEHPRVVQPMTRETPTTPLVETPTPTP